MNKKALLICMLAVVLCFCSCTASKNINAEDLLCGMLLHCSENTEGNGYILYFGRDADSDAENYLSEENRKLLYGDNFEEYFSKIEECAVFISARTPAELAVFKCYSSSYTREIEKMCLERADILKVALRNTKWEEKSKSISVQILCKKYVLLCFTENNKGAQDELARLVA